MFSGLQSGLQMWQRGKEASLYDQCLRSADTPTTLTHRHAAGIPSIALCLCKKRKKQEKKKNAVQELLMWRHFHEEFLCCLDFFLYLFLPAWAGLPTEHCCLFDQQRMARAPSEETKQTTHSPPSPLPPLPHSPRKQVAQPGVNTLHLAAFSCWWSKKQRRRGDSALMTAEASACSAASLSRSEEHEEGDERRAPSAPAGLPGAPQLHPG